MTTQVDSALVSLPEYREQNQRLFPSEGSLQWYVRQHKQGLAKAGAILLHAGRWYVRADRFNEYVETIAAAAALKAASAETSE